MYSKRVRVRSGWNGAYPISPWCWRYIYTFSARVGSLMLYWSGKCIRSHGILRAAGLSKAHSIEVRGVDERYCAGSLRCLPWRKLRAHQNIETLFTQLSRKKKDAGSARQPWQQRINETAILIACSNRKKSVGHGSNLYGDLFTLVCFKKLWVARSTKHNLILIIYWFFSWKLGWTFLTPTIFRIVSVEWALDMHTCILFPYFI